jgi:hypothetical protein
VAALVELRKRQAHESEVAGSAYGAALADLDWYTLLLANELGPDQ